MTNEEALKFSSIVGKARAVLNRVDEKTERQSPTQTISRGRNFDDYGSSLVQNNMMENTQPELDYSEVYGDHVDAWGNKVNLNFDIPREQYNNDEMYEQQSYTQSTQNQISDVNVTSEMALAAKGNSRLGFIIDEIAKNPLNPRSDVYDEAQGVSVLDRIGVPKGMKKPQQAATPQTQQQTRQMPQIPVSIDYSQIKNIVENELKRYTTALKKSLIEEGLSKNSVGDIEYLTIGGKGKQIKVVTEEGKIYEVTMKYVGDVKK